MPFFTWNASFSVGVKEMDAQHQKLVEMINRLHDAMRSGKGSQELGPILYELVDYSIFHFSAEEKLLTTNGYPALLTQRGEHDGFTKKVKGYQEQYQQGKMVLSIEVLNFLKDWLAHHIQVEDKKYGPFLNGKGIS
jgi:hemerythrin-like metal-binding protein